MFGRLEHSFEQERQFTSDASHELRTPTSVILAQCEYTLEQERSPEEYRDALRVIYRQGKAMAALVNDMLDVTRLELRPEAYPKQELDLAALTREICNELLPLRKNNISLTCQAEGRIHCFGNRELLSRALTNLVVNAYQYGRENGHIAVELCDTGASVRLRITDDGIGIAPGDQEKIFQRFYRADSARTTPGTGLGLSMVRQIVLFHGGSISVDSTLGQGSSFTLDFPKSSFH